MFRNGGLIASFVLLGLASGTTQRNLNDALKARPQIPVGFSDDFDEIRYSLGDFSSQVVSNLLEMNPELEGRSETWNCELEFGIPPENFATWIHPVDLRCSSAGEDYFWPLGEGEFRKAYTKGRILIQGVAAKKLAEMLNKNANSRDVTSPISSRIIQWGPSHQLKIASLRRSQNEGDLHFSLECYTDEESLTPLSCALQSK